MPHATRCIIKTSVVNGIRYTEVVPFAPPAQPAVDTHPLHLKWVEIAEHGPIGGLERRDLGSSGRTGYLDFLTEADLGDLGVRWGTDSIEREFLAVRLKRVRELRFDAELEVETTTGVLVLHQRYSDDRSMWVAAGFCGELCAHTKDGLADVIRLLETGHLTKVSGGEKDTYTPVGTPE